MISTSQETASGAASSYILNLLFSGTLHTGDQVDLDAIAADLGISKIPVREAVIRLERDGVLDIRYRRNVVVTPFEPETVSELFDMYGHLSALASKAVAIRRDPDVLDHLANLHRNLRQASSPQEFFDAGLAFRRAIHDAGARSRLHASLTVLSSFVPASVELLLDESGMRKLRPPITREWRAIRAGDPEAASAAAIANLAKAGKEVTRILRERGIFGQTQSGA